MLPQNSDWKPTELVIIYKVTANMDQLCEVKY